MIFKLIPIIAGGGFFAITGISTFVKVATDVRREENEE